jgi:hypothetical protein
MGFSRADWITVAVTLLLFGIAYYVSGPRVAVWCLIAGVTILIVMMLLKRDKERGEPIQSSQQTANPSLTQNASPTINVNIGTHPDSVKVPAPAATPKSEPNVKFLGIRLIRVEFVANVARDLSSFHESSVHERARDADIESVVACFRNEGLFGRTVKPIRSVKANLKLFDANHAEIGTGLSRAFWLGRIYDVVDLVPGEDSQCVILLVRDRGKMTVPAKTRETDAGYAIIGERFVELTELPHSIEVSLFGPDDQLLLAPLSLELDPTGSVLSYREF